LYKTAKLIYPANFETKIGFDKIRDQIAKDCLGSLGRKLVDEIRFSKDYNEIYRNTGQVYEFKKIITDGLSFPLQEYNDITPELRRIITPGSYLNTESLVEIKLALAVLVEILQFSNKWSEDEYPFLKTLTQEISINPEILQRIEKVLDDHGEIRDNASPRLKEIRKDIRTKQTAIDRKIGQSLQLAKKEGWINEDVSPTIRNGRSVLPLPVTHKRRIHGIIHDESATGQTIYIEPSDIFEINNQIRELEISERREIIKILTEFTDFIRPDIPALLKNFQSLGHLDFIRAKSKHAIKIIANRPIIDPSPVLNWINAMHPLLYLAHKSQNKKVVSQNIALDENQRILIISGPNAGGKSICLKTIGLLQYMFQCGLLVPLDETSIMGIYNKIFLDIGDEQSIENDLSTYSSHLLNIKYFVEHTDNKSLFLIDEFGTGTEPQLGGAIAEAALEKLYANGSFGVVTTHYSNLKLLPEKLSGIINGAMLFDARKMQPLYNLKTGKPGSSYAFEIANKIGFPSDVLDSAASKTGTTYLDFDQQLQQLEIEKEELEKKLIEFRVADDFLAEMIKKYETLNKELKTSKETIISKAKEEAKLILSNSNKLIENTIREIREHQAEKEKTKQLRDNLRNEGLKLKEQKPATDRQPTIPKESKKEEQGKGNKEKGLEKTEITGDVKVKRAGKKLATGDYVRMKGQETPGEIVEIKGKTATVVFNNLTIKVAADKLYNIESDLKEITSPGNRRSQSHIVNEINARMANFKLSIDIRGKRADEALAEVRKYIDEAILLNIPEITILHGKGDGVLRSVVRDLLKSIPEIKRYEDEHIERGGHGITIVSL